MTQTYAFRRNTGLTLIELLIVVIILGILAAAVVPLFGEQSVKARVATLKADLATVRTQFALYQAEHDGLPPGVARQSGTTTVFVVNDAGALTATQFDVAKFRAGQSVTFAPIAITARTAGDYGNLMEQLLGSTDRDGRGGALASTKTYGPYLQKIPNNQFATNGIGTKFKLYHDPTITKTTMAADTAPATGCDFYYSPYTLEIIATGTVSPMPANETEQGVNTLQDL